MKSNRNVKCTLDEVELIKGYLIKHFHISTSKKFYYNETEYRMLSIRTFTPKELRRLHRQVKLILRYDKP